MKRKKTHPNDMRSSRLRREQAEDARTTSDIKHFLVFEQVCVAPDGTAVGAHGHGIVQPFLVDPLSRCVRHIRLYTVIIILYI